ncbi:MAG: hypothetical protein N4A63_07205 [Vallitalea sp.]|jgi:hypothetical protein|nr:hypothetical protein [Vallitalea sp.]
MTTKKNYAWPVTAVSKVVYDCFNNAIKKIKENNQNKNIVVFGAGIRGTLFSMMLEEAGIKDFVFSDNNEKKCGGYINEYPIIPLDEVLINIENKVIFITVENGRAICSQLSKYGLVENKQFFLLDPNLYSHYIKEFKKNDKIDVLTLGDCGLTHISLLDNNKLNLDDLLREGLSSYSCKVLGMHGMGMRAFYNILCAQLHMGIKLKYVIMLVNFDTFTGKQHYLPRSQHSELIKRIAEISKLDSKEMVEYVKITEERFNSFHIEFASTSDSKTNKSNTNALYMKMNYMYKLKPDNEGIVYLTKILDLVKEKNISPILFIPPVNYMRGEQYFGTEFYKAYDANCILLKQIIKKKGFDILDLSYTLLDCEFADVNSADECANYIGRQKICEEIINYFEKKGNSDSYD